MKVTITRQQLVDNDACSAGLACWDRFYGDAVTVESTAQGLDWIVRSELRFYLGWMQSELGISISINLRGADLRGADLRGADLYRADLRNADLRNADLDETDLSNADLTGADLRGADLQGANLSNADLRFANLRFADLSNASLLGSLR